MQRWRRSHNKVVGKVQLRSNHIPYMLSGWSTIWKIIMQQTFSYRNENSESGNGRRNPERIYIWRPVGFDHRNSKRLGETETVLVEGTHRVLCAPGPRKKNQWPHKRLGETYLFALEGILWRWGGGGWRRCWLAYCKDRNTEGSTSGEYSLARALLEVTVFSPRPGPTQQPVGSNAGTLQAKQPTRQEHSPPSPISR